VSDAARKKLRSIGVVNPILIYNGIPDTGTIRQDFTSARNELRFYSVCRVHDVKNLRLAIDIIGSLVGSHKNIRFDIYGDGPAKKSLVEYVERMHLVRNVIFKGFCENPEDLGDRYDFYLSTSIVEGLSLSLLGAMRARNIIIQTCVGELSRHLEDQKNCCYIDFDLSRAVEKIRCFLTISDEKYTNIQELNRKLFLEKYTKETFIGAINSVTQAALEKAPFG